MLLLYLHIVFQRLTVDCSTPSAMPIFFSGPAIVSAFRNVSPFESSG